ncbi:MAG: 2-C-methyl-D-erythritol 2,4-cyclodiphosphate synthase [Rhodothermales bacterium]
MRIGFGFDVHRLVDGRPLIIGGVEIPGERGLLGHSDADVLLHAVADAVLGAAALGDIGRHFPDTDPRWEDADSADLLRGVARLLDDAGYRVQNVDATVVLERPRLKPYIDRMQHVIAEALSIRPGFVSVKATTNEQLDAIGRLDGAAAHAVCLIEETGVPNG